MNNDISVTSHFNDTETDVCLGLKENRSFIYEWIWYYDKDEGDPVEEPLGEIKVWLTPGHGITGQEIDYALDEDEKDLPDKSIIKLIEIKDSEFDEEE